MISSKQLAPTGTTGNNTHTDDEVDADRLGWQINIEAVGSTPTATFTIEGTLDGQNWLAVGYITAAVSTEAFTAVTLTAVGVTGYWANIAAGRFFRRYRVRVTANTNVTYSIVRLSEIGRSDV